MGPLRESFLVYNSQGKSKGMAVVVFQRPGDAVVARQKFDGKIVDGREFDAFFRTVLTILNTEPHYRASHQDRSHRRIRRLCSCHHSTRSTRPTDALRSLAEQGPGTRSVQGRTWRPRARVSAVRNTSVGRSFLSRVSCGA